MAQENLTVSQLNQFIKNLIDSNGQMKNVTVKGEISNFTNHIKTGHFYFTLKDKNCSIRAIMFKSYAQKIKFDVKNGMNVILTGDVRLFERDGICQIYCSGMEPDGIGALYLAFEQLKQKLDAQGLFAPEHKKPIPAFPKKIGVVTSKTGAAFQDIVNILSRRFPIATIVLVSVLVQGENAPKSICDGLALAQTRKDIDVLIVGRGGGSIEDLWCFNDERVARSIYQCTIPVISAVGHEIDFTIADFAADLRAPTPSAAAELCAPDIRELVNHIETMNTLLYNYTNAVFRQSYERLRFDYDGLKANSPSRKITAEGEKLTQLAKRFATASENGMKTKSQQYLKCVAMLEALNPLKVLLRGYSVTYHGDSILTETGSVAEGDQLRTLVSDGEIVSQVQKVKKAQLFGHIE